MLKILQARLQQYVNRELPDDKAGFRKDRGNRDQIGRTNAQTETPILWPLMQRTDSFEKTLMLGKIEGGRRRGQQRMRLLMALLTQWT